MGGRVDVESREGLGTRFTISLPIQAASSLIRRSNSADNNEVA
jgi:signal transduction histidine kinase